MTTFKTLLKQHAATLYFILTFAITWGCMALVAGPGGFPLTGERFEAVAPLVYTAMLVGPSAAAILLTALIDGRVGFRELGSRLLKWRVGGRWYAVALLATPLLATLVLLVLSLYSPEFLPAIFTTDEKATLLLTGIGVGLAVGFFEELGWIGFVVPHMRTRYSVLASGLIVGFLWGVWHFPPFWEADTFSGAFPLLLLIVRLFAWLPPYRVLMVWVYDHTDSLLVAILMHASLDASMLILPAMTLTGRSLVTWILAWSLALWVCVAVLALATSKQTTRQTIREQAR
ncbi:MAG: CPBP family intramembrane metalloprotease [Anaerolineales bacterium]|nr:CPBP family intramembrane metalloprotease [Anaerolineales bacterium]